MKLVRQDRRNDLATAAIEKFQSHLRTRQIHSKSFPESHRRHYECTNFEKSRGVPTQQQALWSLTCLLSKSKRSLSLTSCREMVQFRGCSVARELWPVSRFFVKENRGARRRATDPRNISSISCHGWPASPDPISCVRDVCACSRANEARMHPYRSDFRGCDGPLPNQLPLFFCLGECSTFADKRAKFERDR